MAEDGSRHCLEHKRERFKQYDKARGGKDLFYDSKDWKNTRLAVMAMEPFCRQCQAPTQVVDHIVPRSQGGAPFDRDNLQGLCHRCHNRKRGQEAALAKAKG